MRKKLEQTESGLFFESNLAGFQKVIYDNGNKIATLDFSYLNDLERIKKYQILFNDPEIIARANELLK